MSIILLNAAQPAERIFNDLVSPWDSSLHPITSSKGSYQVFGFAPFWTFDKLDNVDFNVLTTFAYFGVDVDSSGDLDREGRGYQIFKSKQATQIFKKAHDHGTRVVLTLTQMKSDEILSLMDNPQAQQNAIDQAVSEVQKRGIDGINVDFEYGSDPGEDYRQKFSQFIKNLSDKMHQVLPESQVSVSVYASAVKEPKIYDIASLSQSSDAIFMMAYDFGYLGSDQVIPTSPLYGYKQGKYWYDVSTAVEDFLKYMPANKLILGNAWYGYNYLIYGEPRVKAEVRPSWSWRGAPKAQTYAIVQNDIKPNMEGISDYKEGWDDLGKASYKAYYVADTDTWKMVFYDDPKSLSIKYDFAKSKNLAGIGMWALGFDDGKSDLWNLIANEFGSKFNADSKISQRAISGESN